MGMVVKIVFRGVTSGMQDAWDLKGSFLSM